MAESRFVYVTYIRATPQAIWDELTDPERNKLFWSGYHQQTSWKVGDDYEIVGPDGRAWDTGKVLANRSAQAPLGHLAAPARRGDAGRGRVDLHVRAGAGSPRR